jgi:fibronectin-binding autotransporter adhesin
VSTHRASPFLRSAGGLALAGVLALGVVVAVPSAASAAPSLLVTSLLDDGSGGTLREAVDAANLAAGPDVIDITAVGTIALDSVLTITDGLSIVGPGAGSLTITRTGDFLLAQVVASTTGLDVSLTGITLDGGGAISSQRGMRVGSFTLVRNLALVDSVFTRFEADTYGAGLLVDGLSGTFTSINTDFIDNTAIGWSGAGLELSNVAGAVTITDNEFLRNAADSAAGLSVSNSGALSITGSTFRGNNGAVSGGAVELRRAPAVTISNTRFESNGVLTNAGGAGVIGEIAGRLLIESTEFVGNSSRDREGGALFIYTTGQLDITGSSFTGNSATSAADGRGGALNLQGAGPVRITGSTFANNAGSQGGAVYLGGTNAAVAMSGSTFTENVAANGGAIFTGLVDFALTVESSTLSRNEATGAGGAMGGAISVPYVSALGTVRVSGSTFVDNYAEPGSLKGGSSVGITWIAAGAMVLIENSTLIERNAASAEAVVVSAKIEPTGRLTIASSTIFANGAVRVVLGDGDTLVADSIIDGNVLGGPTAAFSINGGNPIVVRSSIVAQAFDAVNTADGGGNRFSTDALLGVLQNNGGLTQTMEPLPGSPAIDAGEIGYSFAATSDQRGAPYVRIYNGRVDVGAVEVQVLGLAVTGIDLSPALPIGGSALLLVGLLWVVAGRRRLAR